MHRRPLIRSFLDAVRGFAHVLRTQRNAKIEIAAAAAVAIAAWMLRIPAGQCALLAITVGVVLAVEVLNTAIEIVVDMLSPQFSEPARLAKDTAAGAVLAAVVASVVVAVCVFGPPLCHWLSGKLT